MRSHAKAPSAGLADSAGSRSIPGYGKRHSLACLCVLGLAAFLGSSPSSAVGADAFPGQGFLPDNRAWEMVSPPEKEGAEVTLAAGSVRAASTGTAVLFDSKFAFGDVKGTGAVAAVTHRADQGSAAWSTHSPMPVQSVYSYSVFNGVKFPLVSDDLSHLTLKAFDPPLTPDAPEGTVNLYKTDGAGASPQLLSSSVHPIESDLFYRPEVAAVTDDFDHIIFESSLDLTADTSGACNVPFASCPVKLYEWANGTVRLAGILTEASDCAPDPAPCPAPAGSAAGLGQGTLGGYDLEQALSDDGSRIFFNSPPDESGRLYMRRDATETIWVTRSEASVPDPTPGQARFLGASPDGTRVLFSTSESLLDEDQTPGSLDLYMYEDSPDPNAEFNLTLLSKDDEPDDGINSQINGVLGMSDGGDRVYFAAEGQLVDGQPTTAETAKIYLWEESGLRYIATVRREVQLNGDTMNWSPGAFDRSSRITSDGSILVFSSSRPQPGYDNGICPNGSPVGCASIYRFDALSAETKCLSCPLDGSPVTSNASILGKSAGFTLQYQYLTRPVSVSGKRVFFETAQPLVNDDSNGIIDVYQWEENGVGGCQVFDGCVNLISSGSGASPSYFGDASADGQSVFLATRDRLSGWDTDEAYDLYVAQVDGGKPEPPPPGPTCEGDSCQPPPSVLNDPTPASSTFSGPGNRAEAKKRARSCARRRHIARQRSKRCKRGAIRTANRRPSVSQG